MRKNIFSILIITMVVLFMGCPNVPDNTEELILLSTNADLSSLTVSEGTLSPAFEAATTDYAVSVANDVTGITVTGVAVDANAVVSANNGVAQDLNIGVNTIIITVTAEDGVTTKDYVVTAARSGDYVSPTIGTLKYVPAGSFQRDAVSTNISVITQPFRMSRYEITREQYLAVMGSDPSNPDHSSGMSDPVQTLNWYHVIAFCNKLSIAEGLTVVYSVSGVDFSTLTFGEIPTSNDATWNAAMADWSANGYRLPTAMEWTWAAIGGLQDVRAGDITGGINTGGFTKGYAGSTEAGGAQVNINDYAWNNVNYTGTTHPVGEKLPNELGLYDMSGHVGEWTWDPDPAPGSVGNLPAYPAGTLTDYRGAATGTNRVAWGGHWAEWCSPPAYSLGYAGDVVVPDQVASILGFRVGRK